jgi:CheY-like chemotaxis protein
MVHGFANQSNGAFTLASEPGVGTQAQLWLPVALGQVETVEPEERRRDDLDSQRTILLVDDEALVRMGTAFMLEELGHTVFEAANGADALKKLADHPDIDTVVTDFTMPKMTGAELAKRITDERGDLPILLITGYAAGDLEIALPQLTKPFRREELAEALSRL